MDFLRNTNIDFMKYRKFFIGFSFAVMAIGDQRLAIALADRSRRWPWRSREWFEVCVVVIKPAHGIADRHVAGGDDGVDGGAAMPARPAPPPLDTATVGEHLFQIERARIHLRLSQALVVGSVSHGGPLSELR